MHCALFCNVYIKVYNNWNEENIELSPFSDAIIFVRKTLSYIKSIIWLYFLLYIYKLQIHIFLLRSFTKTNHCLSLPAMIIVLCCHDHYIAQPLSSYCAAMIIVWYSHDQSIVQQWLWYCIAMIIVFCNNDLRIVQQW